MVVEETFVYAASFLGVIIQAALNYLQVSMM